MTELFDLRELPDFDTEDEALYASSTQEWVEEFALPHFANLSSAIWCREWKEHKQADLALEGLWRSYEQVRAADMPEAGGQHTMSWWVSAFHTVMRELTHPDGIFASCTPSRCAGHRSLGASSTKTAKHQCRATTAAERAELLRQIVFGQDHVIDAIAGPLTVAASGVRLRPERPLGNFLFVGPSGCGKTELARAIAEVEFGSREALIRLDMSEYSHYSDVSRLTGPAPGYMGNDQPAGWLTTKIAEQPRCVLLLDEIEKADKKVFDVLLGVMDAGRLTDGRDQTVSFAQTIVIMTSNIGSTAFSRQPTGFGDQQQVGAQAAVRKAVGEFFRPEFVGRIDGLLHFNPLTTEALETIALNQLEVARQKLAKAGWHVDAWPSELAALLVSMIDRPEHGARPLHTLIDKHVVTPIVDQPPGELAATKTASAPPIFEWAPTGPVTNEESAHA